MINIREDCGTVSMILMRHMSHLVVFVLCMFFGNQLVWPIVIPPAVSEPFMAAGEDSVVHVEPSDNVVQDPPVLVHQQTQVDVVGDTSA
ncbi:hypothetical protein V6N13_122378 [Hibiscus sabdariffa]